MTWCLNFIRSFFSRRWSDKMNRLNDTYFKISSTCSIESEIHWPYKVLRKMYICIKNVRLYEISNAMRIRLWNWCHFETWRICKDNRQFKNVNAVFEYGQRKKKEKNLRMLVQLISNSHWRRLGSVTFFSGSKLSARHKTKLFCGIKIFKNVSSYHPSKHAL